LFVGGIALSRLLTREDAEWAVDLFETTMHSPLVAADIIKRSDLYVVVMNPALPPVFAKSFEDAVLYERFFGNPKTWEHDYCGIARAKARESWAFQVPASELQNRPYVLRDDDTVHSGSAWYMGIPVGVSGVEWYFDESIAATIAAWCRARSMDVWTNEVKTDREINYLGEVVRTQPSAEERDRLRGRVRHYGPVTTERQG
jgi:hypothetical protein